MSDAQAVNPDTDSNEWGSQISVDRAAYLHMRLENVHSSADHTCPFADEPLSGADVFWLMANSLVTSEISHGDAEAALRGSMANQIHLDPPALCGASMFAAHLDGAVLSNAQLQACSFRLAQLEGATLVDANLEHADLEGIRAHAADFRRAILSHADLQGAHLENASLQGANGSDANCRGAHLDNSRLYDSSFRSANLSRARLIDADLSRSHLDHADLSEANLSGADLGRAILEHAILTRATLEETNLEGANLKRVFMLEANLAGARLNGVDLEGAVLSRTTMVDANLESANLTRANLVDANFREASLLHARLINANLEGATLEHANLRETDLRGAILRHANLKGADLHNADLRGADLRGAVMDRYTSLPDAVSFASIQVVDVDWGNVRLSPIDWKLSPRLGDERIARRTNHWRSRATAYRTAARSYIALSSILREQNLLDAASEFAYREQVLNRRALLLDFLDAVTFSLRSSSTPTSVTFTRLSFLERLRRFISAPKILLTWFLMSLLQIVVGYGERPTRAVATYVVVLAIFSTLYHTLDNLSWSLHGWIQAIVISVASFHGRGFFQPSLTPSDPLAIAAVIEAVIGVFVELAFIASFGKRVLRS